MEEKPNINNGDYFDSEDEKEFHKLTKENSSFSHTFRLQDIDEFLKSLENPKKNKTWCKVCDKELKSIMHAKTHYTSTNHLKNYQQIREKWISSLLGSPPEEPKSYCKICNLIITGEMLTNGHLDSETHKRYAEMFCAICDLRLSSKHALWEHETQSPLHLKAKKLKGYISLENTPSHKAVGPCEYHYENIDYSSPKDLEKATQGSLMESPSKSDSESDLQDYDEKCQNYYCPVCDIQYLADQYYPHMNEFPHTTLEILKDQYSPRIVQAFCSVTENKKDIFCLLCNITMRGPADIKSHLNGVKHIKKLRGRFPELFDEDGKINPKKDRRSSSTSLKQLNGFETVSSLGSDQYSCYLCKLEFKSKLELNAHSVSFPHIEMAKWKSEAVSLGVPYAEYWVHSKNTLTCTLCNVQISSNAASKIHMNDLKHKTHLVEWCKEFATWKCGTVTEPKLFFCEVCDLRLPGTSEAQCHYMSSTHIKRAELYCKTCKVSNSSEKMLLEHQMSNRHKENIFKDDAGQHHGDTSENKNYHLENLVSNSYSGEDVLRVTIEDKVKPEPDLKEQNIIRQEKSKLEMENCITDPPFSRICYKMVKLQQTAEATIERDILKEILTLVHLVNTNKCEKVLQLLKKFNSDLDCGVLKFRGKDDGDISC
ncbi:zinc finger protein 346-like isoform X2 [Anthonomus grandis grandis]|uniref:zinc finger protein 346-like isoform X2 n=1 Tax=Anthonomus grandis grandis TaxID=2921223 RepID=UPI002166B3D6|nr:zinc finger protein 346-like isoform X2 [Anthonomus grandis grandis]